MIVGVRGECKGHEEGCANRVGMMMVGRGCEKSREAGR